MYVSNLKALHDYITNDIGFPFEASPIHTDELKGLAMFLVHSFDYYHAKLDGHPCILVQVRGDKLPRIETLQQQIQLIQDKLLEKVILCLEHASEYQRKKLTEKRINFIQPQHQLYLPDFYLDVRPTRPAIQNPKPDVLQPLAQQILIGHLLDRPMQIGSGFGTLRADLGPFQLLAVEFNTNAMAITRAATNLRELEICEIVGARKKFIRFNKNRQELWDELNSKNRWLSPVLKTLYVDTMPDGYSLRESGETALSRYTSMNPPNVPVLAMDKGEYYQLRQRAHWDEDQPEGNYLLQVWRYNPAHWGGNMDAVDPISLYLVLKEMQDERVQMALEKLLKETLWS